MDIRDIICCHCKHKHENDFDKETPSSLICEGCGRKVRIEAEGSDMRCEKCGFTCPCEECTDNFRVLAFCIETIKGMGHDWKPTLCSSHEKCARCYEVRDIRKLPQQ